MQYCSRDDDFCGRGCGGDDNDDCIDENKDIDGVDNSDGNDADGDCTQGNDDGYDDKDDDDYTQGNDDGYDSVDDDDDYTQRWKEGRKCFI